MPSQSTLNKFEREPLFFIRWVLLLLTAADSAGLEKMNRQRLHFLLFISFSGAPFYGIQPLRQRAQRTEQGPYYRAAHIALGNMILSNLVEVKGFSAHLKKKELQFDAEFYPTKQGLDVSDKLREAPAGQKLYKFLLDLCLGVISAVDDENARVDYSMEDAINRIFNNDLSYQRAIRRSGDILYVEDYPEQKSATVDGLNEINAYLSSRTFFNQKDVLKAYHQLILRRSA